MILKRLIMIMASIGIIISTAYAADSDWLVHIKVSAPDSKSVDGASWTHLIAGVREGATDGFDSAWDTISMAEADDAVQSMFTHGAQPYDKDNNGTIDRWICNSPEVGYTNYQCSLWRDLRSFEEEKTWSILVLSPLNGGNLTIEWNFEKKPENIDIVLVDLSNPAYIFDMKSVSRYGYTNNLEAGKKYGIRQFEIRMKTMGIFLVPPSIPDGTINMPYDKKIVVVGGNPEWGIVDGEMPPGMTINSLTGEITGTPTAAGSYTFTVKGFEQESGYSISREFTLNINSVPEIYTDKLPDSLVDADYKVKVEIKGGSSPFKWNVNGNLPEGLTIDSNSGIISGKLMVPGIYDFTVMVSDINMAADSRELRIVVVEPEDNVSPSAINDLKGVYSTDTSLLLMWSSPADNSRTRTAAIYDLRYLEECAGSDELSAGSWDSAIEANWEPKPQTGTIHTYTLTGILKGKSYCVAVRSMDASGNVSDISNVVKLPLGADAGISDFTPLTASIVLEKGYNVISVPFIPVPNGRDSLFGALVGTPVSLYRWYSAYPGITPPQYYLEDVVEPGYGYFLYSSVNNVRLNIDGLKLEDTEYGIILQNGWNMIGNPYDNIILLNDVIVKNVVTGERKSYVNAVKTGWIGNSIYALKSGNYDFASFNDDTPAVLEPWIGYWIHINSKDAVEIIYKKPN